MNYKIGYISKISGVSTRTLRFYEQKGLIIPKKDPQTNYRYYTDQDINTLQQILLYKELGLELSEIKPLIQGLDNKTTIELLESHLNELSKRQVQIQTIINTIQSTIQSIKGEITMKNDQKFEGLKNKLINDNDTKYKDEVIDKYGNDSYEQSKKSFKNMTKETFDHMNNLNDELIQTLIKLKNDRNNPKLEEKVFNLHKEWITITWGKYNPQAHKGVTDLYISDERFTSYYDNHEPGIAKILRDTVHKFILD